MVSYVLSKFLGVIATCIFSIMGDYNQILTYVNKYTSVGLMSFLQGETTLLEKALLMLKKNKRMKVSRGIVAVGLGTFPLKENPFSKGTSLKEKSLP